MNMINEIKTDAAKIEDGGAGAFYIFLMLDVNLKKKKKNKSIK